MDVIPRGRGFRRSTLCSSKVLIKAPAFDLRHDFIELGGGDGLVHETFAPAEFREVPSAVLELGGNSRKFHSSRYFGRSASSAVSARASARI